MSFTKLVALSLPAVALGANAVRGLTPFQKRVEPVCVIYTVVEYPIPISTCFLSATVYTCGNNLFTTTIPGATCLDTTVTVTDTVTATTTTTTTAISTVAPTLIAVPSPSSLSTSVTQEPSVTQQSSSFGLSPSTSISAILPTPSSYETCNSIPGLSAGGSAPATLNNATYEGPSGNNGATAVYIDTVNGGNTDSFGYLSYVEGAAAQALVNPGQYGNPGQPATDYFAFYALSSSVAPPTDNCLSYGYIYHIDSGMCVTVHETQDVEGDSYDGSTALLEPCQACGDVPSAGQTFCVYAPYTNTNAPYQCVLFEGDNVDDLYGPNYGYGDAVFGSGGNCVFLTFPEGYSTSGSG